MKSLWSTVRLGVSSLLLHKLRSFLTTLGVLFGVASVVAMLAVGEGASEKAQDQIRQLGSRNVILRSIKPEQQAVSDEKTRVLSYGLTRSDFERVAQTFPGVIRTVPVLAAAQEVRVSAKSCRPKVLCTTPEFQDVVGRILSAGRFILPQDEEQLSLVCVLGYDVSRFLFPFEDALGQRIRIGAHYFEVVGVLIPRGPLGESLANPSSESGGEIFVPLATGRSYFGERQTTIRSGSRDIQEVQLHEIIAEVGTDEDVAFVAAASRAMLVREHEDKDYEVVVPLELLMRARETQRIFSIVLASIAGISLLVGGIGIMNVMLATVTERTREIGIRRALGARRRHIVVQFLVETTVLSGCGGAAGVALGLLIPWIIERTADLETEVSPVSAILAFGISVGIGVIFGLYPAWRAAHMDPVDALRHE
ncbi:MAG: putative ABC transport system permease protein [Planctomycetota bacterium]|jgi:putative ABC transport system permease protein